MLESLIISLILTIIIELFVSLILGIREIDDIKVIILINICTNPIVVYIANCLILLNNNFLYNVVTIVLEILVVIVEFKLYKQYLRTYKKSTLSLSLINNILSFGLGLIISNIF